MVKIKIKSKKEDIQEIDKEGNENRNDRLDRLFPGWKLFRQSANGIMEKDIKSPEQEDYTNCKVVKKDKTYKKDKKSGEMRVRVDKGFDCDYRAPVEIDSKAIERWKKLANIQHQYNNAQQVKIAKPAFDRFMKWLDQQAVSPQVVKS